MVVRTYAIESLLYRTAGMIDARIAQTTQNPADPSAALAALEEYAIEASIAKVAGSEVLNDVLDENIQVHGGNGYVRDYPAERHYRDSRVNRIFEGTNEINRLLISGILARRAAKGDLPIIAAARALQDELMGPPAPPAHRRAPLADEKRAVEAFRKIALMVVGLALQTYGQKLSDEQEVLMLRHRHPHRRVRRRQRGPSRERGGRGEGAARRASRGCGPRVRQRRRDAHRRLRATGARRDGRGRQPANGSRRAAPSVEGDTRQYRRPAAPAGRRSRRSRRIYLLGREGCDASWRAGKPEVRHAYEFVAAGRAFLPVQPFVPWRSSSRSR